MKCASYQRGLSNDIVAPVRERGLKYAYNAQPIDVSGRSREGARIEIYAAGERKRANIVAPVRERGLKLLLK